MAILTLIGTLGSSLVGIVGSLLQNSAFVLILLGAAIGFHFGDDFGKWRQAKADGTQVKQPGGDVTPSRLRPIRDLIHFVVGDPPDGALANSKEDDE